MRSSALPGGRQGKRAAVLPRRIALHVGRPIFLRFLRHVRRVYLERIASRNVDGCTITIDLPVGRNGQRLPIADAFLRRLRPTELPLTIKQQSTVTSLHTVWNEISASRLTIDLQHVVVLPVVMLTIGEGTHEHGKSYKVQYQSSHISFFYI